MTATASPSEAETAARTADPDATGTRTLSEQWRQSGTAATVADSVVYVHDGQRLGAWNATDGRTRWTRRDEQPPLGVPVVDGGSVYVAYRLRDGGSRLRAFDASDGSDRWETRIDGRVRSTPLPAGGSVLLNVSTRGGEDENDAILGVRRDTGERRWERSSGLVTAPGTRRLGTTDGEGAAYVTAGSTAATARVSKLAPATGERRWDWTGETPASAPVYADGTVYLGTYADVTALDADTGERRWRVETFDTNYAPPVVVGDTVYAGSRDSAVYAIATGTGATRWRERVGGGIDSVAATETSVVAGHRSAVTVLEASGAPATGRQYEGRVERVAHADDLLVVAADGETVAYRVSAA